MEITGYYYAQAQLWVKKIQTFAGIHSNYGVAPNNDEASGIPSYIIYTRASSPRTAENRFEYFSNLRRNTGPSMKAR